MFRIIFMLNLMLFLVNYSAFSSYSLLDIMNVLSWQNYWGGGKTICLPPPPIFFYWGGGATSPPPPHPQDRRLCCPHPKALSPRSVPAPLALNHSTSIVANSLIPVDNRTRICDSHTVQHSIFLRRLG